MALDTTSRTFGHEGRSRRPPGRRDELLAAALEVIGRVGPSASMEQMAAEAGITKPVLYRYFGDRDGLIAAMADRFADELVGRLNRALEASAGAPPAVVIRAGIEAYVAFIEEDPSLYRFLTQHAAPDSAAFVSVVEKVAEPIALVISSRLAAAGLDERPASTWAHGVVGIVHMAGSRWASQRDMPRSEIIDHLVSLIAYGLATGGQPLQPGL